MHVLIPYAWTLSPACQQAWPGLRLPRLQALLERLTPTHNDAGDEYSPAPPHERALARALGLQAPAGQLPWAAQAARDAGLDTTGQAWAFITPCHWRVARDHIVLTDPAGLALDAAGAADLCAALQPYFAEDGISLHLLEPTRWLASSPVFDGLTTASLDRVLGRNIDAWMPEGPQAAPLRRLQNEMQMLLYTHPVNDARAAQGLEPVNSFWVSGAGRYQPATGPAPRTEGALRTAALQEDGAAWARAWQEADAGVLAELLAACQRGTPCSLTLCGERQFQTWENLPRGLWQRFGSLFGRSSNTDGIQQL